MLKPHRAYQTGLPTPTLITVIKFFELHHKTRFSDTPSSVYQGSEYQNQKEESHNYKKKQFAVCTIQFNSSLEKLTKTH